MTRGWVTCAVLAATLGSGVAYAQPPEEGLPSEDGQPWYERGDGGSAEAAPDEEEEPALAAPTPTSEPVDAPAEAAPAEEEERPRQSGFFFGSYGRISAVSNLRGGLGRDADIVAFNPRIDEDLYFELELRREDELVGNLRSRVVATVAFTGEFFHLDSEFDENIAVRNLFAEVNNALVDNLSLWVGSRMWRGDDVYLLNFWPLDNLNTIGGGVDYRALDERLDLRLAVGLARPDDPFHRQVDGAVANAGFLPADVVVLDRPRTTVAAKATFFPFGRRVERGAKISLYAEGHFLPEGRRNIEFGITEVLPRDGGYVLGGQIGGWDVGSRAFVNLFFRWSRGLGAYNPLGVPFRVGGVMDSSRAREALLALSANWEHGPFGLQAGAYYRNFRDADPTVFDRNHMAEGAVNLRPHVWIGDHAGLSFDLSYQALQMSALDEVTGKVVRGGVTKIGFIPFYSPFGRGTYTRPHLRIIYAATIRDDGAQRLYPLEDPRSRQSVEHFLGVGAEWWFDSTSYGF
ncbi:MAG: carbohydrate porin [Sandaracinus sp.]|nr:carbohydrate porin [Sandaracinus sp.]